MTTSDTAYDPVPDPKFLALAVSWTRDQADLILGFVWAGYDRMRANMPVIDPRDLERAVTQRLVARINDSMTGDEPFYVLHSAFEHASMLQQPAQPPANDFAFLWREEERIMWPLEAKILETPDTLKDYIDNLNTNFLTFRYAPFSSSGAMVGYLLSGTTAATLTAIEAKLNRKLSKYHAFEMRPHRTSNHQRIIPVGKKYPVAFQCHHLIFEFLDLKRQRKLPG